MSDSGPAAGATFTLSATVRNAGEGDAAATMLRYYRSTDTTITRSDTEVGMDVVAELAASGSSSQSVDLTASAPGTYYYGACVDAVTDESDATNNCSASVAVTVPEPEREPEPERHPDLVVRSPTVSDSGPAAGATFTLSATVRNAGDGAAAATTLRYYLSTDATITRSDTEVGMDAMAELAASGSSSQSVDLTAPSIPGTYYYGACVHPVTDESDTANNCSDSVQVTVPERAPSVEIGAADDKEWAPAGDTMVLRAPVGDTVELTVRVLDDQGEEIAGATVSWSSSNTNVATVDSSGVMTAVGVGSVTLTARATLPASSTQSSVAGRSAAAASRASGQEVARSEGSVAGSIDVEVVSRASRIEITPASVSFEEVGARATLTATIYDQDGNVMQPTYWAWSSADRAVATVEGLSLASGIQASVRAIGEGTTKVTLSANGSATGTASVTVAAATVRAPQPDLVVGSPSVNESAPAAGAPFTLSATVENEGEGESEATTLRYYRSTDATITTSDTQEGTDEVPGLAPSGTSTQSVSLTAPSTPGTYYYGACVDAVTNESDTTNNCIAHQVDVSEESQGAPDLVVAAPTVNNNAPDAGATFTLSAKVRNDGDESSAATTLRFYHSTDATITTSDTQVGTAAVAKLAASGTSDESVSLTAPSTAGTYYYGACVDAVTDESDTTNNCSSSVQVTVPEPEPDLVVTAPTVSNNAPDAGATFTLSAEVRNDGDGSAAATTLRYYRSTDATITTSDTQVGTDEVAELAASGTSDESVSLTAPSAAGTYYYGACVDAVTGESETTNNCSSSVKVTVATPDLVVVAPSVTDSTPDAGATFTLSATVRNDGDGSSAATTLRYYRSTDATITTSDTQEGTDEVPALAPSGTSTQSVSLTAPSTPGTYYYGACVDAVTDESDTTNNCIAHQVDVSEESQGAPDLVVAAPTVNNNAPDAGATFTLSAKVRNDGDESSAATTLRFYHSTDATITTSDTQVGTAAVAKLAASGTSDESVSLTAPSTAGTYYYGACVDEVTGESETTNNCSSSVQITVPEPDPEPAPDLVVTAPTVSNNAPEAGATFTLSAEVRNDGDEAAAATTLRYYRSTGAIITTSDTELGTDDVGALAASGTSDESVSLTATLPAGTYYYGACVDAVTGESDTTNNCSSSVQVTVAPPDKPDLIVYFIIAVVNLDGTRPGGLIQISAEVRNLGGVASPATTLRFYQSTDATITTSDTEVGMDDVGALAASGTSGGSARLTAPSTPGTYYYGACVDSVTDEFDTTNNCSGSIQDDVTS